MIRQHEPECIVPGDLPAVRIAPWEDISHKINPKRYPEHRTLEYSAHGDVDVAGYADAPDVLFLDGDEVTVAEAEEQALAVLAVLNAMRADGVIAKKSHE